MMCRERLCLHDKGHGQHVDMDHSPSLAEIWSRRHDGVSRVLQSNVDAVIAQVHSVASVCKCLCWVATWVWTIGSAMCSAHQLMNCNLGYRWMHMLQLTASNMGWSATFCGVGLLWWMAITTCRSRSHSAMMQHIQPSYRFVFTSSCEMPNHNTRLVTNMSWADKSQHCMELTSHKSALSWKITTLSWADKSQHCNELTSHNTALQHHIELSCQFTTLHWANKSQHGFELTNHNTELGWQRAALNELKSASQVHIVCHKFTSAIVCRCMHGSLLCP